MASLICNATTGHIDGMLTDGGSYVSNGITSSQPDPNDPGWFQITWNDMPLPFGAIADTVNRGNLLADPSYRPPPGYVINAMWQLVLA